MLNLLGVWKVNTWEFQRKVKGLVSDEKSKNKGGEKMKGRVKWYSDMKGFGFIESEEAGKDVFVHNKDVGDLKLFDDDVVEFDVEETPKGLNAKNIKIVKGG